MMRLAADAAAAEGLADRKLFSAASFGFGWGSFACWVGGSPWVVRRRRGGSRFLTWVGWASIGWRRAVMLGYRSLSIRSACQEPKGLVIAWRAIAWVVYTSAGMACRWLEAIVGAMPVLAWLGAGEPAIAELELGWLGLEALGFGGGRLGWLVG